MGGKMTEERKIQLISLLDELNDFHVALHHEAKVLELDALVERL